MVSDCFGNYIVNKIKDGKIILTITLDKRDYDDDDCVVTTSIFDFLSSVKVIKKDGDFPSYDVTYVTINNGIQNEIIINFNSRFEACKFHDFLLDNCSE